MHFYLAWLTSLFAKLWPKATAFYLSWCFLLSVCLQQPVDQHNLFTCTARCRRSDNAGADSFRQKMFSELWGKMALGGQQQVMWHLATPPLGLERTTLHSCNKSNPSFVPSLRGLLHSTRKAFRVSFICISCLLSFMRRGVTCKLCDTLPVTSD